MAPDHARIEAIARRRALTPTSRWSASLRNTRERSGTNVATLAMTRHILMKNGIAVPKVVARCAKSRTPVATLTIRPTVTARKTQR